jgi:hypothetical protein
MSKVALGYSIHHKKIHSPDVSSNTRECSGVYGRMCNPCEEDKGRLQNLNGRGL